jgi:PhnB protein
MTTKVRPIPEGYHTITPQLTCRDAARAIEFYKEVFGAKEIHRMAGPGGKVMHAELQIGDSRIMLADEYPGMSAAPDPSRVQSSSLFIYTENVDSVFNHAVKSGAKGDMPPADMFWGDRFGRLTDPFGHLWGIATHIEDVVPQEMEKRMKAAMAQMSQSAGQKGG